MSRLRLPKAPSCLIVLTAICLLPASGCANDDDGSQATKGRVVPVGGFRKVPRQSCFFSVKGVRRWCLDLCSGCFRSSSPCDDISIHGDGSRYVVEDEYTKFGYIRRVGPGRWRAMLPAERGSAPAGTIIRAAKGRWAISSRGRRLGFTYGPYSMEVGAVRLLAGGC
jgi:hypothetical protein